MQLAYTTPTKEDPRQIDKTREHSPWFGEHKIAKPPLINNFGKFLLFAKYYTSVAWVKHDKKTLTN